MATTTNYGWDTPDDTDLVKDGAAAIRTLGSSIDTTVFNNAALAIPKSTVDAKADLLVGTADNTVGRLAVGTNGHILVADSTVSPTGLKWAAPAAGGKVLQVVQGTHSTALLVTTTAWTDTGLTASITPSAATSKILVMVSQPFNVTRSSTTAGGGLRILRSGTFIYGDAAASAPFLNLFTAATGATFVQAFNWSNMIYLDSPSSTSSLTYKTQLAAEDVSSTGSARTSAQNSEASIILLEIGA